MFSKYQTRLIRNDLENSPDRRALTFSQRGSNKTRHPVYSESSGSRTRPASQQKPPFTHLLRRKKIKACLCFKAANKASSSCVSVIRDEGSAFVPSPAPPAVSPDFQVQRLHLFRGGCVAVCCFPPPPPQTRVLQSCCKHTNKTDAATTATTRSFKRLPSWKQSDIRVWFPLLQVSGAVFTPRPFEGTTHAHVIKLQWGGHMHHQKNRWEYLLRTCPFN